MYKQKISFYLSYSSSSSPVSAVPMRDHSSSSSSKNMRRNLSLLLFIYTTLTIVAEDTKEEFVWPCEDEEPDCFLKAARGNCYGFIGNETAGEPGILMASVGLRALSVCRSSCRKHYKDNFEWLDPVIHRFIEMCGGVEDRVADTFGYKRDICDISQAFVMPRRADFLSSTYQARMTMKKLVKTQKQYTEHGIKLSTVPKTLFGDILDFYKSRKRRSKEAWKREKCDPAHSPCWKVVDDGQECSVKERDNIMYLDLGVDMSTLIHKALQSAAEEWAGVKLEPTVVFGIRRYRRGAWFSDHVDRNETHIISAIINVAQKVDEPWPLDIFDYQGVHHKVIMKPGDLVWYESANLPHGRIQPFKGKYYDNIFVHYKPVDADSMENVNRDEFAQLFAPVYSH